MNIFLIAIVGILSGAAGSLGLGGGAILLLYLTLFADVPQLTAQGINLLFFIPCAAVAVYFHSKAKLIKWKCTLWCGLGGVAGAIGGYFIGQLLGGGILRKVFGGFLLFLAIYELFFNKNNQKQSKT